MRWPWQTEKRSGVYSDAIVTALLSRAAGTTKGNPSALSGLEIAAGLWSRALSTARVEPDDLVTRAITPSFLAAVGRSLIRHGQSLWAISVNDGPRGTHSRVFMGHNGREQPCGLALFAGACRA